MRYKIITGLALMLFVFSGVVLAQEQDALQPAGKRLIEEIKAHHGGMKVWWTGHNGWIIKSGNMVISTDLCLESPDRKVPSPVSAEELAPILDIAFITHEHGDHFEPETCKILAEKSKCMFVLPKNCEQIALDWGIPTERIKVATPREPFTLLGVKVKPMRAIHGNPKFAVFYEANMQDCGYLITLDGRDILQPGDTVLLEDHLFLKHVDVLFLSPTEHNMVIEPSVILINELEPDYIFPQHRDTFKVTPENRYWTTAYQYEVMNLLSRPMKKRYHILDMGEGWDIK